MLVEIDPRPFQVQLELAQATLARDQALLDNAKLDVERYVHLVERRSFPHSSWIRRPRWSRSTRPPSSRMTANIDNAKLQLRLLEA